MGHVIGIRAAFAMCLVPCASAEASRAAVTVPQAGSSMGYEVSFMPPSRIKSEHPGLYIVASAWPCHIRMHLCIGA